MSHEELVAELPKLEKLSNAARLKHAKKRRQKQLKRWQDWVRLERRNSGGSTIARKRSPAAIDFEKPAQLAEMVARNDIIGVQRLLQEGMEPNISNADGLTPLHKCCIDNTVEMAEILLEHRTDVNARDVEGWTPLHAASATGNIAMINLLLEEGASLVAINHDDKMPVDVSCDGDIKYILQQRMLEAGYTDDVLEYIRVSVPKTMLADLKDSVKNDRSLNIKDKYGSTALHVAAANGYTEVLEFLLSQPEIDLNIQDNEGWTPFHAAVCWGQQEAMKMLAEKGATLDVKDLHGETAYAIADDPSIREYLLELKGEFSEDRAVDMDAEQDMEKPIIRARRASVKRTSNKDKEQMSKQALKSEAMMRRASMAKEDAERAFTSSQEARQWRDVGDEIGGEEDDETVTLVAVTARIQSNDAEAPEETSQRALAGGQSKYEEFEVEEALTSRPIRKSILRQTKPGPVTTFASSPSSSPPPGSPTGSGHGDKYDSNRPCCVIV